MEQESVDRSHWIANPRELIKPERKKARNIIAISGERGGREFRSLTDPLDYYVSRSNITERQYDAGDKLRRLWHKAAHSAYSQGQYDAYCDSGGRTEYLPVGMFAVEYRKAMDSIRGEKERKIAHFVCCENIAASRCFDASARRTAQRRGMRYLISALDDLAAFFKC